MNRKATVKSVAKQDGFALWDVILGIAFVIIGLTAATMVMANAAGNQKGSTFTTIATHLAEETLEKMRTQGYQNLAESTEDFGEITEHQSYKRQVIITVNTENTLKTVEVVVDHVDGRSVSLSTRFSR